MSVNISFYKGLEMIRFSRTSKFLGSAVLGISMMFLLHLFVLSAAGKAYSNNSEAMPMERLASQLQVGDVVFIRVANPLYRKVADANGSWTNHVGIVIDVSGPEPVIAESRVPRASATTLSRFIARSENARLAIRRLPRELSTDERQRVVVAAQARFGQWYDLGFDLHSKRQFCSKYVHEVLLQATGESVGKVESFASLLAKHPDVDQRFWKWWYLGAIPWQRETITPASQYESERLETIFDGRVVTAPAEAGHNSPTAAQQS